MNISKSYCSNISKFNFRSNTVQVQYQNMIFTEYRSIDSGFPTAESIRILPVLC